MDIYKNFIRKWADNESLVPVSEETISLVEDGLCAQFPKTYRIFIKSYGSIYCPNLLDAIVEGDSNLNDLQNFINVIDIISSTNNYTNAGMPKGYIVFANDCMGNMFCFKGSELKSNKNEAKIWFFDHDFVTIEYEASCFEQFISRYLDVERLNA